ncbi:MAG TPA: hypothetical protein VNN80_10190 [Polyangiaceae bacterium]|nr:hypothetical protein [Polyangiaceae bacterium]
MTTACRMTRPWFVVSLVSVSACQLALDDCDVAEVAATDTLTGSGEQRISGPDGIQVLRSGLVAVLVSSRESISSPERIGLLRLDPSGRRRRQGCSYESVGATVLLDEDVTSWVPEVQQGLGSIAVGPDPATPILVTYTRGVLDASGNDAGGYAPAGVMGVLLDPYGCPRGTGDVTPIFRISNTDRFVVGSAKAIAVASNEFVVIWEESDYGGQFPLTSLKARRVSVDGFLPRLSEEISVDTGGSLRFAYHGATRSGAGELAIAWFDRERLWMSLFATDLELLRGPVAVLEETRGSVLRLISAGDHYFLAWEEPSTANGVARAMFLRVSSSLEPLSVPMPLSAAPRGDELGLTLVPLTGGGAMAAWMVMPDGRGTGGASELWGAGLAADGKRLFSRIACDQTEFPLVSGAAGPRRPVLGDAGEGRLAIGWAIESDRAAGVVLGSKALEVDVEVSVIHQHELFARGRSRE